MSAENAHTVWRIELLHAPTKDEAEHEEREKEDGRGREGDRRTGGHKGIFLGTTDMLGIAALQEHLCPYGEKQLHKPTVIYSTVNIHDNNIYMHIIVSLKG